MRTVIVAAIFGIIAGLIWSVAVDVKNGGASFDVCQEVNAETGGDGFVLAAVGCDEDLTRAGNMCNRYAYRLAKSWIRSTPDHDITPYLEALSAKVEEQSSRGHECEQYEDGSYGFPSKQIDCKRSRLC